MEENNKLFLSDVVKECKGYLNGEITQEEIDAWGENIMVKTYLPIVNKMEILYDFYFSESSISSSIQMQIAEFETKKFWKILLKYTNIEIDDESLCNFDNYDICFPVLNDFIVQYCFMDYDRTCKMVSDNILLSSVKIISDYLENISIDSLKDNNNKTVELLKSLSEDKKLISDLSNLMIFNDPKTKELINNLKTQALKTAKNKK